MFVRVRNTDTSSKKRKKKKRDKNLVLVDRSLFWTWNIKKERKIQYNNSNNNNIEHAAPTRVGSGFFYMKKGQRDEDRETPFFILLFSPDELMDRSSIACFSVLFSSSSSSSDAVVGRKKKESERTAERTFFPI